MKRIFISYSHKDKNEKKKVEEHLSIFEKYSNTLKAWSDSELKCGDDINPEIIKAINEADAAILIVSTNFLNSDFIRMEEIPRLLKRREEAGIPIFPFIVKTCNWQIVLPVSKLLARPYEGKALNSFKGDNKERILTEFAKEVNDIITKEDSLTYDVETKNILNKDIKDNKHILEQLYNLLTKFEGLNFIPPNTLSNFQPFHSGKETAFHYEDFVLYTLNPELYWFFDNIKIADNKIEISEELSLSLTKALLAGNHIEKIEYIIKRLNQNLVFHIEAYKDVNKAQLKLAGGLGGYDLNYPFPHLEDNSARFQIQKEFHPKNCQCIQCLYHDLKFVHAYELLESILGNEEDYSLKSGYIAYNLGSNNYKDAYLIFKHLKENSGENPIQYFIASYNLKYLYYDIKGNYSLNDKEKILDYIREIDLDQIIYDIKDKVDSDVHRVVIEIKEEKFISKIRYKIDDIYAQIIKLRDIYSREGSRTGPNYVQQLHVQMALLFGYYEWNYLIGNKYGNVTNIITRIFEALLISQTIEKYDGRFKEFNSFHLLNAVLFINPKKLQNTFISNNIDRISVNQDSLTEFINVFNNFLQNNHKKTVFGNFIQKEEFFQYVKGFYVKQTIVEIFRNCLFLLSKVVLSKNKLTDSILISLLNFLKFNSSNLLYGSQNELSFFISEHKDLFTSNQLEELIELWITKEYLRNTGLPKTISEILIERASFRINDRLAELIMLKLANKNSCSDFHHLIYLYKVVSEKKQQSISDFFVDYINKDRIDSMILWELYFWKVISTEDKEILKKFVNQSISKEVKETETLNHPFGDTYKNYTYLNFISIVYYLDMDRRYITSLIPKDVTFSPYCEWLLKFDFLEFDYSTFNLQWLLFKKSETFFNQFKKEPRIKKALGDYLSKEFNSELGEIYMKNFYKK
ncbi:MAG: toll/interleukin-1 receptor domain-containing protein [Bacteroidales bacterium]